MFDLLKNFAPPTTSPSIESAPTPNQPTLPPTRFGATRIVIAPDPNQSLINISERVGEDKTINYVVRISRQICPNSNYYAELITLLKTVPSESKVMILIGSPGGSLNTGAMIAAAIRSCKAEVTTVAIGLVASAAALIWSYGHKRSAVDGSGLMFHMSSHGDYGNSLEIKLRAENTVLYVKEVAIDPLVQQGLLTPDEAETIIDRRRDFFIDSATINARLENLHG